MKWYHVFIKSVHEHIRDYWILVLTLTFAPFFVFMYYLMSEVESPVYNVVFVNRDQTAYFFGSPVNLGDTLVHYLQEGLSRSIDMLKKLINILVIDYERYGRSSSLSFKYP